jgi:hypothetical protein
VDIDDANEAIAQHWRTGWDALHGTSTSDPVTDTAVGEPGAAGSEWVRMAVKPPAGQIQTLDAQQRERRAIAWVQIFTTPTNGSRRAWQLARDACSILEAPQVIQSGSERIWADAATVIDAGADGAWLYFLVTVPVRWYG